MSVNVYDPVTDTLIPVAGATLYADTPIGAIQAFDAEEVPDGWLIFNGQTVLRSDYPDLWARANRNGQVGVDKFYSQGDGSTTFTLADLRETSLKGYGETSRAVGAHVKSGGLGVGEFIDDQIQNHRHDPYTRGTEGPTWAVLSGGVSTVDEPDFDTALAQILIGRTGTTTEVKAVGVVWAVKAKQVGLPIDLQQQISKQNSYSTSEINTGKKWIDGKPIYRKCIQIGTSSTNNTSMHYSMNLPSNARVISVDANVWSPDLSVTFHLPYYWVDGYSIGMYVNVGANEIVTYVRTAGTAELGTTGYAVIEYIKA
jgi:microcystin-dependent protein